MNKTMNGEVEKWELCVNLVHRL